MPAPSQTVIDLASIAMVANVPALGIAEALGAAIPPTALWIASITGLSAFLAMLRPWKRRGKNGDGMTQPPDG